MFITYFNNESSFIKPKHVQIKDDDDKTLIFDKHDRCICNGISKNDLKFFDDLKSAEIYFKNVTNECSDTFKKYVFKRVRKKL